jgi:hypothetical protein
MIASLQRARDSLRFVTVTVVLTLAYLALSQFWLGLVDVAARVGMGSSDATWAQEASQLAVQSQPVEAALLPTHRVDAWRLGFLLGYSTELIGAFTFSPADRQQQARARAAPMLAQANAISARYGIGPVDVLTVSTAADFAALNARVEADENGLAARVAARVSPRGRHLYLLGMHCGMFAQALESGSDTSPLPMAQTRLIARHATLAGMPSEGWKPLQATLAGGSRAHAVATYRSALNGLENSLATGAAAAAASPAK